MIVFARMGGTGPRTGGFSRRSQVKNAPARVAMLPKMMSGRMAPPKMFAVKQPMNRPGIAAGVNSGSMVRASEIRTWTSP